MPFAPSGLLPAPSPEIEEGAFIVVLKLPCLFDLSRDASDEDRSVTSTSIENAIEGLLSYYGGTLRYVYTHAMAGYSVEGLSWNDAEMLARDPLVAYVEPVTIGSAAANDTFPAANIGHLDRIDQRDFPLDSVYRYAYDGSGVHLFIVDSGVDTSYAEFPAARVDHGASCVYHPLLPSALWDPYQDPSYGHGTRVASAALGQTAGVAKGALLHSVRIARGSTAGSDAQVCGINKVGVIVEDRNTRPAVMNFSWESNNSVAVRDAINRLTNFEIAVTKAAQNDGIDAGSWISNQLTDAVVVGAVSIAGSDQYRSGSNYGTSVHIWAPGSPAFPTGIRPTQPDYWGTSYAAPQVAGLAAMLLQRTPSLQANNVKTAVIHWSTKNKITGFPLGTTNNNRLLYIPSDEDFNP